jgi:hypothetical protein
MTNPAGGAPAPKPKRKGLIAAISIVGVLLLASLVGVGILLINPGSAAASEIVLEGAGDVGANPFSADPFASEPPATTPQSTATPAPSAAPVAPAPVSGATPGLYGGTQDIGKCDAQQLVSFLEGNPDKAAAWVAALNKDPLLRWPGGALTTADIRAYIGSLTSVVLMSDTRVTNHGFSGGAPTPLQSVLQAGTAVLVDSFGVPRARCYCGNPLIPAVPVPATTPIKGEPWPGFDPNRVVTITGTPEAIRELLLGDLLNPTAPFSRVPVPAPGSANTSTPSPSATPTPSDTPTPAPSAHTTVPPAPGAFCADPYAGGPTLTYSVTNTTDKTLDVFYYDENCNPVQTGSFAPFESGTVFGDLPNQTFVVTSGTPDIISSVVLTTDGGTWTIQ